MTADEARNLQAQALSDNTTNYPLTDEQKREVDKEIDDQVMLKITALKKRRGERVSTPYINFSCQWHNDGLKSYLRELGYVCRPDGNNRDILAFWSIEVKDN